MLFLENEYLKISIRRQGAELTSVYNKLTGIEHIWQADPQVWGWHAPNLFPVVGACINNEVLIGGKPYPMERHGFTRTSQFTVIESAPLHAKLSLHYTKETLQVYPYKFEFQILYDLMDNNLRISYKVVNHDEQRIYFSVGAHPAFNVPFSDGERYEDYYLEFEHHEPLDTHQISAEGFFTGATKPLELDDNRLPFSKDLFKNDALVFKNLRSRKLTIKSRNHTKIISTDFHQFNYLGIWAKPGAPFVCIEPWLGCADTAGHVTELKDKEAIRQVEHGHVFEADYTITVG